MNQSAIMAQLAPFASSQWHPGQLLAFSALDAPPSTDYEAGLVLRTTLDPAGLEIVRPATGHVIFAAEPTEPIIVSSDFFAFQSVLGWTMGCLLDAHHLLITGSVAVAAMDGAVKARVEGDRCLLGSEAAFDAALIDADLDAAFAARSRWILSQPILSRSPSEIGPLMFKALSVMKGQVCSPEGTILHRWTTPDRWPHKDMWLWDSVFHAIGWRHLDPALAREMIDAVFDGQRTDGFIPHQLSPSRGPSTITQPPLLAYGVSLVNEAAPDHDWLRRTYPKLCAYVAWDLANRDEDGDGLLEWLIEGDPVSRSGESGMDNSPRFDFHYPARLAVTDFNAYLALECETLAGFAAMLGRAEDAASWRRKHATLCSLINRHLWSEADEFYCDYDSGSGARSPILSSAGFLPLICGAATPDQAAALARHLRDPSLFATACPVPSIARRDDEHYSKDMWRGPSWVNINWLIARGLERYASQGDEFLELARALDAATLAEVERRCRAHGTFFEYFDDQGVVEPPLLLRKGICDPRNPFRQVIHDYGWTTTLYLDLVCRYLSRDG
jgi:hypothetical protein